jgi:hypothetical protein
VTIITLWPAILVTTVASGSGDRDGRTLWLQEATQGPQGPRAVKGWVSTPCTCSGLLPAGSVALLACAICHNNDHQTPTKKLSQYPCLGVIKCLPVYPQEITWCPLHSTGALTPTGLSILTRRDWRPQRRMGQTWKSNRKETKTQPQTNKRKTKGLAIDEHGNVNY